MNATPSLRTRRRRLWLGVLAVTVFGLRATIPTGYMLAAIDGHVRLVVCPASVHYVARAMASGAMAMGHGMGMDHGGLDPAGAMSHASHAASGTEHCPYAFSGGASLLAAHQDPAEPYYSLLQPAEPPAVITAASVPPPRYHAPRGPPSLA